MDELTKIMVIKSNEEKLLFNANISSPNHFLFSSCYLNNQLDEAINLYIEKSSIYNHDKTHCFAPFETGLTVIDFNKKQIFALNHFIQVGKMRLSHYDFLTTFGNRVDNNQEEKFNNYHKTNKVFFVNSKTQEQYTALELFGTNEVKEILSLINNPNLRNISTGKIKDYHNIKFPLHHLRPHNLNLKINYYNHEQIDKLFIDLYQVGFKFDSKDIQAWYDYMNQTHRTESENRMRIFLEANKEKNRLENKLNCNQVSNKKQKL